MYKRASVEVAKPWWWTRQRIQRQPEVHVGEKHNNSLFFHILFLPTEVLRATSIWHRALTTLVMYENTQMNLWTSKIRALVTIQLAQRWRERKVCLPVYRHTPIPPVCCVRYAYMYVACHMWIWLHKLQIWSHKFIHHIKAQTWKCYMCFSFACYTKKQAN